MYDGGGHRLRLIAYVAGVPMTTTYTLDIVGGGLPLMADNGITGTLYLYGLFGIGEYDTEWRYYLGDAQLSVRQLLDDSGNILMARTYDPFGLLVQQDGAGNSLYGYAGSLSGGGGLLFINGRYFDPATGRFLSPDSNFDPLQPSRTLNWYIISIILSNPGALLFGPLLILSWRKRRGGKGYYMLWLMMGLGLGLTLVACGQNGEETPSPTQPPPPQPPATPEPPSPPERREPSTPTAIPTVTPDILPPIFACPTPPNGIPPTSQDQPTATIGPLQELVTIEQRKWAVEQAIQTHHGEFPSSLVLAIAAAESGRNWGWNNTNVATPDGYPALGNDDGIMQVTPASDYHQESGPYTNTKIGIEANIIDGIATLRDFLGAVRQGYGDYGDAFDSLANEEMVRTTLHYNAGNAPIRLYNNGSGAPGYLARIGGVLNDYVPQEFGAQYRNDALVQDLFTGQSIVCQLIDPGLTVQECP